MIASESESAPTPAPVAIPAAGGGPEAGGSLVGTSGKKNRGRGASTGATATADLPVLPSPDVLIGDQPVVPPDARLRIIIDTREQKGWTFDPKTVVVTRKALKEGDYTVEGLEGRVAVERKSLGDFVSTVIHDWIRFRKELVRLSGYDLAVIAVEADLGMVYRAEYESEALPSSILGRCHSILIEHGIPVVFWGDRRYAQDMAHRFLLQAWRKLYVAGPEGPG